MEKTDNKKSLTCTVRLLITLLFLAADILLCIPFANEEGTYYLIALLAAWWIINTAYILFHKGNSKKQLQRIDVMSVLLIVMLVWIIIVPVMGIGDPVLYPSPMRVMQLMAEEFPRFLTNFQFSIVLMMTAFAMSLVTAVPFGIFLGINKRVGAALSPYIKVLSQITPIVYVPYIIGIMPTFRAASLFVIYTGTFWPALKWTMYGVGSFSSNYALTAKLLKLDKKRYYLKVLIPGIMPEVLSGVSQSLAAGFSALVAAEMIGAGKGLGYIIKYFADFLNYHKVIVGIIYLGISVCTITWIYEKIQAYMLSWQTKEKKGERNGILGKIQGARSEHSGHKAQTP